MIAKIEHMDVLEGRDKKISASIGALVVEPLDMDKTIDVGVLISIADNLMYKAKTAGKSRVEVDIYAEDNSAMPDILI